MEKQAVVLHDGADADVIAFAEDELEAAVQIFYVRDGRVRGQRGWVVDRVEDEEQSLPELVELFLLQMYADDDTGNGVPREVLVPVLPPEPDALTELLCELRGTRVELRVPQRGDKRALLETVERNAQQSFQLHKLKRASDLSARSLALQEIQNALGLNEAPLRIECFDVSNLQGTEVVASMVVFEDGLARKSEYRRFAVRGLDGQDDVASMHQVIRRRFSRYLEEREQTGELGVAPEDAEDPEPAGPTGIDPQTGRPKKFAYPPNLVVVDGGPPQVAAAAAALKELGIDDIALVGLAKRLEELWLPDNPDPVILPRTSEGLYLLQRVRDEAHRFAITFHRQRRSRTMTESALDGVPGLGDARRKALLKHFGSLKRLRAAGAEEIAALPGFGPRTAAAVVTALRGTTATPAIDPTTGEIIEDAATGGNG
jgi:excinuclease ABC subunit C